MVRTEDPDSTLPPAPWALDRAASDLYDEVDPKVVAAHARELERAAGEIEDERHDEFDDPDEGGEA
ncbi:hypothetical protein [Intrasporangium sp.]|uniref:hypothetical protein n=1 Tax=Intrasporangium sp. TaxID=1925024 RepID=UPI00293AA3C9|nr:hypothetical protein [Intrasporangium sp.]MDV3223505.1 hypothetical protein [Intrasporangium sp.]